ncbi:MFS transporter [Clostridiaceae bacterium M8S5]|nr:MFS transporter [Clostridiaceae bacterium M8S5]
MSKADVLVNNGRLSCITKLGYGIGTLCDSLTCNLYNIFFLVFAVDFVGLDPAFAGVISSIAVLWDALTDPIVGYISDKLNSSGKLSRQKLIIRALVPLTVSFIFLYKIIEASPNMKNIYYTALALCFWTCYTVFMIPYAAVGAEMTNDYEERSSLRFYAHIFTMAGLLIASSFTMSIVEKFMAKGLTPADAWFTLALAYGAVIFTAGLICWISISRVKMKRRQEESVNYHQTKNIFTGIFSTLKLRSLRKVCIAILLYATGFTLAQGTIVFLMQKVLGFDGTQVGKYFMLTAVIGILSIPVINGIVKILGKRKAYTVLIIIFGLGQIMFKYLGVSSFGWILAFGIIQGCSHNVFFPMSYALVYDCCDIDAFVNRKRREGIILSVTGLMQKIGYAIGTSFAGLFLKYFGYNSELQTQTQATLDGMQTTVFVIAPLFFIVSAIMMSRFKINKENYNILQNALEQIEKGNEPSAKGLEELI